MRLLKSAIHPDVNPLTGTSFNRKAARAIVLKGTQILVMFTARYDDYSLPGGGIDDGESQIEGLIRELTEETGAQNIRDIKEFGLYEEFRPWYKSGFDSVHMESYCFICNIDDELAAPKFEQHEINNGMKPVWMNIYDAIHHNEQTIKHSIKKGMSIERETFLLRLIAKEIINTKHSAI